MFPGSQNQTHTPQYSSKIENQTTFTQVFLTFQSENNETASVQTSAPSFKHH